MQSGPLPDWFLLAGGVGVTAPGEDQSVEQVLEPGTYFAFGTSGEPTAENAATIEVSGDASDDALEPEDGTVNAFDYNFKTEGLTTGENEVLFENTGVQPHHVVYAPIKGDATLADIEKSLKEQKGPPPIDEKSVKSTTIIEGGTSQLAEFNFDKPGRYALLCFIADREGGPPHVAKGMIAEVDVK
jgi:plastocyanin